MTAARWFCCSLLIAIASAPAAVGQPARSPNIALLPVHKAAIGVTRKGTEIPVWLPRDVHRLRTDTFRVLIIGGLDGSRKSTQFVQELAETVARLPAAKNENDVAIEAALIPNVYPDAELNGEGRETLSRAFPPAKGFYDDAARPEAAYLWRWVAMYGAHLVIDVREGKESGYWHNQNRLADNLLPREKAKGFLAAPAEDDFVRKLTTVKAEDMPPTPTALLQITNDEKVRLEKDEFSLLMQLIFYSGLAQAQSRDELMRRQEQYAGHPLSNLTQVYGHDLKQVAYIPALAVIGRLRSAEAKKDFKEQASLRELLAPYLSGELNPIPKSGSDQAGHLLFAEMAKRSEGKDRERWIDLCRAAADQIFDKVGKPKDLMPFHNEMSDAVFMATPILCATGKLTGEKKYFEAAVKHFRGMQKLCLREDGLYRHSPLDEAAWGRGNGFPAMGLAWALSEFPEDHADFPALKKDFQQHITALLRHQDEFGCWHQVIDKPGSYREFSATAMIAWSLKCGLDRGWLDKATHQPALARAWIAAKQRIGPKGVIVDICTGTGKQKSLRDYYDRPAIWGVDARGGAMALMLATEMMDAENQ